jgi:hypothetical protein
MLMLPTLASGVFATLYIALVFFMRSTAAKA